MEAGILSRSHERRLVYCGESKIGFCEMDGEKKVAAPLSNLLSELRHHRVQLVTVHFLHPHLQRVCYAL